MKMIEDEYNILHDFKMQMSTPFRFEVDSCVGGVFLGALVRKETVAPCEHCSQLGLHPLGR